MLTSRLAVVNASTGGIASIVVPAGTGIVTAAVSLPVTKGDQIALVQFIGHATQNLGDGAIFVS